MPPPAEDHVSSRAPYVISIRHATADRCSRRPVGSSGAACQCGGDPPAAGGPEVDEVLEFVTGQTLEMAGADLVVLALPSEGYRQLTIRYAAGTAPAGAGYRVTWSLARLRADRRVGAAGAWCSWGRLVRAERPGLDDGRSAGTGSCGRRRTAVAVAGLPAAQGVRVGVRYRAGDVVGWMHPHKMAGNCRLAAAWRQPCSKGEPMAVKGSAAQRTARGRTASGPARRAAGGRT
jgi:hypothetical protein